MNSLLAAFSAMILLFMMIEGAGSVFSQGPRADDSSDKPDHHSCRNVPAFNVSSLPPPSLMSGVGSSALEVTTRSKLAQKYFNQGINLLHCFWDVEAYRAFKEAARQDQSCAMAYWGIFTALALNSQEMAEERAAALKRARELMPSITEHEQYYIRAASFLVEPGKGLPSYISEMEALIDRYPEDVEAKLFLANTLSTPPSSYAPDGRPREGKLYGQAILRYLLITHPDHAAVHHYWIHAVENGPRPEDALPSAILLPKLAPRSGHMLHMPGHIYYRIGEYQRAHHAFMVSMRSDIAYMNSEKMSPINNWNYVHNLDYLVANCAEDGRYREGMRWAERLAEIPIDETRLKARGLGYILYGGHTALARLQMRYGFWEEAAKSLTGLPVDDQPPDSLSEQYKKGVLAYLKGMDAVEKSKIDEASRQTQALDRLIQQLSSQRPQNASDWYFGHANRILAVHLLDLRGSLLSLQDQHEQSIKLLVEATEKEKLLGYWEPPHYTRPVLESLGRAYLRAGRYDEAGSAYERVLEIRPNSGFALFGIAKAYAMADKKSEAKNAFRKFLTVWRNADKDLPQIKEARSWLGSYRPRAEPRMLSSAIQ
jgi:tetratricopeptide (TPR) repeat protein